MKNILLNYLILENLDLIKIL